MVKFQKEKSGKKKLEEFREKEAEDLAQLLAKNIIYLILIFQL